MTQILRARSTSVAPVQSGDQLDVALRHAQAIASAKDAVPQHYRNNVGAVLLAQQWAEKHDIDLLTTMQCIAFIGGKPVVEATMQRALVERHGYDAVVVSATSDAATVEIRQGETLKGSATYTMDHARAAGLANKDNWKKNAEDMLVARATTRAVRRYAPSVLLGVRTFDELDDPIDVLVPEIEPEGTSLEESPSEAGAVEGSIPSTSDPSGSDTVDVEIVFGVTEFKSLIRQANHTQRDAIEKAQEIAQGQGIDPPASLDSILCADTVMPLVVAWLNAEIDTLGEEPF